MSPVRSVITAGLLIVFGALPTISAGPVAAQVEVIQATPMEVTTDTPAYCLHLLQRVGELVRLASEPVPHEVTELTTEGQRMCEHGQIRGGIMRLRSAILIMEKNDGPAYR